MKKEDWHEGKERRKEARERVTCGEEMKRTFRKVEVQIRGNENEKKV